MGEQSINNREREPETQINNENINIEKTTFTHTWEARGQQSTIHLTLTNGLAPNIVNWQILQGVSDHAYINHEIEYQKNLTSLTEVKCIDWNKFDKSLRGKRGKIRHKTSSNTRQMA